MAAFASERDATVPPVVQAAWDRALGAWDDTAAHDELFAVTAQHACYAWTAARYRGVRKDKGAAATDPHLGRVGRAAEVTLLATATARREQAKRPYGSSATVLLIAVVMIVVGLLFAMAQRRRPSVAPRQHTPAAKPGSPMRPQPVQPAPQVR